jgi:hypothetical protein
MTAVSPELDEYLSLPRSAPDVPARPEKPEKKITRGSEAGIPFRTYKMYRRWADKFDIIMKRSEETGFLYMSKAKLRRYLKVSERTARSYIDGYVLVGWLVDTGQRVGGSGVIKKYKVNAPAKLTPRQYGKLKVESARSVCTMTSREFARILKTPPTEEPLRRPQSKDATHPERREARPLESNIEPRGEISARVVREDMNLQKQATAFSGAQMSPAEKTAMATFNPGEAITKLLPLKGKMAPREADFLGSMDLKLTLALGKMRHRHPNDANLYLSPQQEFWLRDLYVKYIVNDRPKQLQGPSWIREANREFAEARAARAKGTAKRERIATRADLVALGYDPEQWACVKIQEERERVERELA